MNANKLLIIFVIAVFGGCASKARADWYYGSTVDRMTDKTHHAAQSDRADVGKTTVSATIGVMCNMQSPGVSNLVMGISFYGYMPISYDKDKTYKFRFDKEPVMTVRVLVGDGFAMIMDDKFEKPFRADVLSKMQTGKTLLVETDKGIIEFSLAGSTDPINQCIENAKKV